MVLLVLKDGLLFYPLLIFIGSVKQTMDEANYKSVTALRAIQTTAVCGISRKVKHTAAYTATQRTHTLALDIISEIKPSGRQFNTSVCVRSE